MRKVLVFVILGFASLTANAQIFKSGSGTTEGSESKWTGEFNFYVQDAWGIGLMARKETGKYFGWNVIGLSYMSGWHKYDTPDKIGILNVRLMGVRFNAPIYRSLRLYAEATPGYTFMYAKPFYYSGNYSVWTKFEKTHCFGFDCGAGFEVFKNVALGYNFSFFVNGNGNSHIHWGRVSILF